MSPAQARARAAGNDFISAILCRAIMKAFLEVSW